MLWNTVHPTYNCGLISNCLFLRIIPNGCAAKPLSTLHQDYSMLKLTVLMYVPSNWCNFDLRKEIEGFIGDVMTEKYNGALFPSPVCRPIVRLRKCASASCNPVYLHPPALSTRPRRTRT